MQEPLIIQESVSGRSWTSKVFNTVINLDNYQFFTKLFNNIHVVYDIVWWFLNYLTACLLKISLAGARTHESD